MIEDILPVWITACLILDFVLLYFFGPPTDPRDPNNCGEGK